MTVHRLEGGGLTHRSWTSRALGIAFALLGVAWAATACSGPGVWKESQPPLRIGVTPNYPPIVFRAGNRLVGVEPELGAMLAAHLGRRPQWVDLAWGELIPSLERGDVDVVMSGMSITEERAERVLFSDPYLRVGQLGLIRRSDLDRFGQPAAIRRPGARVGYVRGTTGQALVERELAGAEPVAFEDAAAGVQGLRAHEIDFFVHDAPTIWRVTMDAQGDDVVGLFRPLSDEQLAWAVARGDVALKRQLDAALAEWRATSRLEPVLNRWIPVRVQVGQ